MAPDSDRDDLGRAGVVKAVEPGGFRQEWCFCFVPPVFQRICLAAPRRPDITDRESPSAAPSVAGRVPRSPKEKY